MINLIPPAAKKRVVTEYWLRVVVVWEWLAVAAIILIGFMLVPASALINSQTAAFSSAYQDAKTGTQSYTGLVANVTQANLIAKELIHTNNTPYYSNFLTHINSLAPASIHIHVINMSWATSSIRTITVDGVADSRSALAQFKDTLSNDALFSNASLPLSNLAKDKDVPFLITLTTK